MRKSGSIWQTLLQRLVLSYGNERAANEPDRNDGGL